MTWRDEVMGHREQGFDVLDWLSAVQHADGAVVEDAGEEGRVGQESVGRGGVA